MNIYKVNYLNGVSSIREIHVFCGNQNEHASRLNSLFATNPEDEVFSSIFNKEEHASIRERAIPVKFIPQSIHNDDAVGTVKSKIMNSFQDKFSIDEIYLFAMYKFRFQAYIVFNILTENKRVPLSHDVLSNFFLNIVRRENMDPLNMKLPNQDTFSYDDLLGLQLENQIFLVNKPIDQTFFVQEGVVPHVCNPFELASYSQRNERKIERTLGSSNKRLLLNSGSIVENNLYMCLADDVLPYRDSPFNTKLYYPFLAEKEI